MDKVLESNWFSSMAVGTSKVLFSFKRKGGQVI